MKSIFIILACFLAASLSYADEIVLDTSEAVTPVEAIKLTEWEIIKANNSQKILVIKYRMRDAAGNLVITQETDRSGWRYWTCRNTDDNLETAPTYCTEAGMPWPGCTGAGTGDPVYLDPANLVPWDETDTCFSDVFGFTIRAQDVGAKIGIGLRTLIWNKMRPDVLSAGNDGVFDSN